MSDITQQVIVPSRLLALGHNLELEDGIAQDAHRIDKAQPIRRHFGPDGRIMHHGAHRIVRQEQSVQLLQYPHGGAGAQRLARLTLMSIRFIDRDFDFPPLMVSAGERVSGIEFRIEQGTDQTMAFAVPRAARIVNRVLDDADQ